MLIFPKRICAALAIAFLASHSPTFAQPPATSSKQPHEETWRFDRIGKIGGHKTEVLGHPSVIESPYGKAVEFHGNGDAIIVPEHPLATATAFTWEVIFRPDGDGPEAQRFFHIAEVDPATGKDTDNRLLFEIRIVDKQWCLDSFAGGNRGANLTLLNCKALHPLDQWYRVTAVWDGKKMKNYVGDELQGEGSLVMPAQGQGRSSIGMRLNKVYPFKGAVLMSRTVPRALPPSEFLKMPPVLHKGKIALDTFTEKAKRRAEARPLFCYAAYCYLTTPKVNVVVECRVTPGRRTVLGKSG